MVVGTDKQSIVVTTNDGATFKLNIPNPVDDADLINRISINSEGNVCLDGKELAWKENIPVKVSELDNDEDFVKLEELNEKLKQIVTSGTGGSIDGYTKGEVNTLLNKKLDKPETDGTVGQVLTVQEDGTNAYADVPTYDDTELRELIGDIPIGNLSYEIVETLPEVTSDEAKEHTLYMIKSESDDTGYNQYIIVDGAYKKVGSTTSGAIIGGAIIDDNTVSTTTVFSSNKISTEYITETKLTDKNYADKTYVTQAVKNVKVDLTGYAKTSDIPTKISQLTNDKGYLSSIPSEYVTETKLNAKGYLTEHQDISNLALKSEIPDVSSFITSDDLPTVPTKVSDLANDKNYISSIPSEYVTETELTAKKYLTSVPSTYALKTDIPTVPTKISDLTNDSNFITSIPEEYITETELNTKGYLTSHQDISGLQTKTDKNLVTTSKEVVGAINEVKSLNDTKLNKTDANKLDCVTIDNVSLKEYILTNFTETGKTYYLVAKTTCTDLPKASNFYITVETPGMYTYKVTAKELNDSNGIYVCTYRTISSSWTAWQKVCTTTVADVNETSIEFDETSLGLTIVNSHSSYKVINGICYVTIELNVVPPSDDKTYGYTKISTTRLPKIGFGIKAVLNVVETSSSISAILDKESTDIKLHGNILGREGSCVIQGSFSYPVAE